ncbi:cytochrome c nitrite reductase small subunit [Dysgonomonas sp. PH5-45]|uniref:cytochrome c nitrite reductase small subunit n=1 Tax=unclassified Dysgonomonas TaxID=2630389 RepID=UPI002473BB25|nr:MULTISPECIES: cytochrome c nitrite reductase small subunit [unclassified Dysgonomonas]MDH6355611.1 cytochrome c nitrite reductase small subunit [Dysgonomonas sp. PH5-45]MDH6388479.1 cytochrome c nitrite reductase small subunit [Dysgonomonas sp. PH5-37]
MRKFLNIIPWYFVVPLFVIAGIAVGLGGYSVYMSRAHSYLSDDPSACVNCHIMTPYYQSWMHSSHHQWANCNDCHVPQDNQLNKYAFKAMDGLYHAAVFTLREEPQVIRPRDASKEVIMNNCIRCHTELNTEFVNTGMINYTQVKEGEGKACWDCHREVPHTEVSNLSSSPNAIVPLPQSPVPDWLKNTMKNKK